MLEIYDAAKHQNKPQRADTQSESSSLHLLPGGNAPYTPKSLSYEVPSWGRSTTVCIRTTFAYRNSRHRAIDLFCGSMSLPTRRLVRCMSPTDHSRSVPDPVPKQQLYTFLPMLSSFKALETLTNFAHMLSVAKSVERFQNSALQHPLNFLLTHSLHPLNTR
jgi:hypothetical protein